MRAGVLLAVLVAGACGSPAEGERTWHTVSPTVTGDFRIIASRGDELWALGMTDFNSRLNVIVRWDGTTWTEVSHEQGYWDIFVAGPGDIWLVGDAGKIARWNGTAFGPIASGVTTVLTDIWGASSSDLWIVQQGGPALLHWDGVAIAQVSVGTQLRAISGTASDDVWAVGDAIYHFDGASWTQSPATFTGALSSIHAVTRDLAWTAAPNQVLRWDGAAWAAEPGLPAASNWTFAGASPTDAWALGASIGASMVVHWDGVTWTVDSTKRLVGIATDQHGALWGAGSYDVIVRRDTCGWIYTAGALYHGYAVTGAWSNGTSAWMTAGPYGGLTVFDDCAARAVANPGEFPQGLGGIAADDLWIPGAYGEVAHWDGATITYPTQPKTGDGLFGVWAATATDAWAVGVGGRIVRWDGQAWTDVPRPTSRWLTAVWGRDANDVWAVGEAGTIVHWDGAGWTELTPTTRAWLGGIWGTADRAWAVGEAGTILELAGNEWTRVASGVAATLFDIRGRSSDDVWIVGDAGTALHYDGAGWYASDTGTSSTLSAVAVGERVWIGGSNGFAAWR
jgi:hypothetical protein